MDPPGVVLGPNRYGKAEVRVLHVARDGQRHDISDLNVSVALAGDLAGTHLTGDNTNVLPTDTQKNTVYAFARQFGVRPIEEFARRLGEHFVTTPAITRARVRVEQYSWQRIEEGGSPHPHAFERASGTRVASVEVHEDGWAQTVAGLADLVLLKSTGSEFRGFRRDRYTSLEPAQDRVLATAVQARWRLARAPADWDASFAGARAAMLAAFAARHSRSLQQTLYAMGEAILRQRPEVCEARLSLPNKHHFEVDLAPFGADNAGTVFFPADRPYGLIEGTVLRAGAAPDDRGHDWWAW